MGDRLYRSRSDRMLAGVAGGLAEMWGADPSLVRIVWALLVVLTGGVALVVYIVMAIVVPEGEPTPWPPTAGPPGSPRAWDAAAPSSFTDPLTGGPLEPSATSGGWAAAPTPSARPPRAPGAGSSTVPMILGGLLILLGGFFLVREYLPQIDFDWFWPAMLIVLGVAILVTALGRDRKGPGADA
jgi:phage shock protein C